MRKEIREEINYTKAKINMRNQANIDFLNRSTKLLCLLINQGGKKRKWESTNYQKWEQNKNVITDPTDIKHILKE